MAAMTSSGCRAVATGGLSPAFRGRTGRFELWDHKAMSTNADRPRAKSLNPLRALIPFLRPYRGMLAAALIALLVATLAMLALPLALRQVIDPDLAARDATPLNRDFIGFMAAAVIFGVSA